MVVPEMIFSAARIGDVGTLREYFASGDRDPNDTLERNGWTLLDGACRGANSGTDPERRVISCEAISFLLSQGASVDYQDPDGHVHCPVAVTAAPLPRDVFKLVISFWRPNREWWWSDYRYSRVNRYDAPWMG